VTLIEQECPDCGGPPMTDVPYADVRLCPRGIAFVVGGTTVVHLSAWEAVTNAANLYLLALKDGAFLFDGPPDDLPELAAAQGGEAA
jgi:hypothetical protein